MSLETLGDLRKLIAECDLPDDTKLVHECDHAGICSLHTGAYLNLTVRGVGKNSWGYFYTEDPEKMLFKAVKVG